ncbi:MAG: hypothetical protein QOF51_4320 [Chloroflexota bacterium]|nr:hypothetical protein [Chloroflexota bacterium]
MSAEFTEEESARRAARMVPLGALTHPAVLAGLIALLIVLGTYGPGITAGGRLVPADMLAAFPPWTAGHVPQRPANGLLGDIVQQMYPWRVLAQHELAAGRFPLWNPYAGGGVPLFANGQSAILFPPNVATYWLSPDVAATLTQLAKPPLAAIGMALFLVALGVRRSGAVFGGVAWGFSGPMVTWLGWPHTNALLVTPYLFWTATRGLQTGGLHWWLSHAGALAIQLFGGHPETTAHSEFALGLFVAAWLGQDLAGALVRRNGLWSSARSSVVRGVAFGASVVLGAGLAAVQVIPLLAAIGDGIQAAERGSGLLSGVVLERETAATWLVPNLFGSPLGQTIGPLNFLNYNETIGYAGLGTLILALMSLGAGRRRGWLGLAVLTIVALGIAYGIPGITEMRRLPGLNQAANTRFIFVTAFGFCALAGIGLDATWRATRRWPWLVGVSVALLAALGVGMLAFSPQMLLPDATGATPLAPVDAIAFRRHELLATATIAAIWGVSLAIVGLRSHWRQRGEWLVYAPLLALVLDLYHFGGHYNPTITAAELAQIPPAIGFLQQHAPGDRMIALGDALLPNAATLYGVDDLRVYEPVAQHRVLEYFEQIDDQVRTDVRSRFYLFVNHPNVPLLSAASVHWVMVPLAEHDVTTAADLRAAGLVQRYSDDAVAMWENPAACPLVYVLPADATPPATPSSIKAGQPLRCAASSTDGAPHIEAQLTPGHADILAFSPGGGTLVVAEALYDGWQATVDGQATPIQLVDGLFMGVAISSGTHRVELAYRPIAFTAGIAVSALSGLCVLAVTLVIWRVSRRPSAKSIIPLG